MDAAEQRVGFFNQELRPINLQSTVAMIAAVAQKICLTGDRRKSEPFLDQALMALGVAADKRSRIWTAAWQ